MRAYLLSLTVGLLVGVLYGALNVKSPAPPIVALIGLLGMLGGEQIARRAVDWRAAARSSQAPSVAATTTLPAVQPDDQPSDVR